MNDKDAPRNNSEDNYDLTDFLVTYYGEDMEPYESDSPGRWIEAADDGDTEAQCNIGFCYRRGLGVKKDSCKAVEWYRMAAEQGHARAQNNLGYL